MKYSIHLKPRALRDLKAIPLQERGRILERIDRLEDNLSGDVKRLTNFTPEYRMRSGAWRILFEVEQDRVVIYRITHRRESYR